MRLAGYSINPQFSGLFRRRGGAVALLMTACLVSSCGGGGDGGEPVIRCDDTGSSPVVLVWDSVVGANGYRIYYRTGPGSYLQNLEQGLDAGAGTTFAVSGLASGTTYFFAVTAYDAMGESDFSNEACQTIQ